MTRKLRAVALWAFGLFIAVNAVALVNVGTQRITNHPSSYVSTAEASAQSEAQYDGYYHSVWQQVKDNFLWQDRLTDWSSWEHRYDGKLHNYADAERAINIMLASLKDKYTFFNDASAVQDRQASSDRRNVVSYHMLAATSIGYIKITTFGSNHVADEVEDAIRHMPDATAFILDLRDDGGGYVNQAFQTFSLFVEHGAFTELRGKYQGSAYTETLVVEPASLSTTENGKTSTSTRKPALAAGKPLAILVNGNTASASEMISGALRDDVGATIIGSQSFGKGIAQITLNLENNTSFQVTFAQYYFPKGDCIHGIGITPTRTVNNVGWHDSQLDTAEQTLSK